MKKFFLFFLTYSFTFSAFGSDNGDPEETGPWTYKGFFSQQLNQVSFSNWAAGGENSLASTSIVSLGSAYESEQLSWENKLEMEYGMVKTGISPLRKNQDRLEFDSKLGRNISPHMAFAGLLNFRTQFGEGFNYPNDSVVMSRFMAPGYLITSLGVDYKPWDYLSVFVSPATGKFTFVRDQSLADQGAFGVDPGKNIRSEFGAMLRLAFEKEVLENVQVASRLDLFNNYTDPNRSNRKNTDVNWHTQINMKINQYLTASVMLHMVYDHDIPIAVYETIGGERVQIGTGPRLQVQQMLGIGLSYSL
jgi:hypothetical protein